MSEMRFQSKVEQVAAFLRGELAARRWEGLMPGRPEIAAEFGFNARTVESALRILERDGVLIPQGAGRRRKIALPEDEKKKQLMIGILIYDEEDRSLPYQVDLVHRLQEAGHGVMVAPKAMTKLNMNVVRVARMVKQMQVDAWIVQGGSSAILKWMLETGLPVMAEFGRFIGLPIAGAGVRKITTMRAVVRRLHELGHRRIVMMAREERRKPYPAAYEQAFLNELESLDIRTSSYNLPDWQNSPASFHRCLDSLFQHTPPTALLLNESRLFVAAQQRLASHGLIAPRDVSLVCDDPDSAFTWCEPAVSHIRWDSRPVVNRIVRWADRISRGKVDKKQIFTRSEFVEGGTIGPAPGAG